MLIEVHKIGPFVGSLERLLDADDQRIPVLLYLSKERSTRPCLGYYFNPGITTLFVLSTLPLTI